MIRNTIHKPSKIGYIGSHEERMYVCICHAVTDREIRECIAEGAGSLRELRAELKVGTQCGKCACDIRALLKEEKSSASSGFASASCSA